MVKKQMQTALMRLLEQINIFLNTQSDTDFGHHISSMLIKSITMIQMNHIEKIRNQIRYRFLNSSIPSLTGKKHKVQIDK